MKKNITLLKAAITEKNASQVESCLKTLNASQDFDINMNYGEILWECCGRLRKVYNA